MFLIHDRKSTKKEREIERQRKRETKGERKRKREREMMFNDIAENTRENNECILYWMVISHITVQ